MNNANQYFLDYAGMKPARKSQKNAKVKNTLLGIAGLTIFLGILGIAGKSDYNTYVKTHSINEVDNSTIDQKHMQYYCYTDKQANGAKCVELGLHTDAWLNCSKYYELPCTEEGELITHFTKQEAQEFYEADMRGDTHLTDFEVKYLIAHTDK